MKITIQIICFLYSIIVCGQVSVHITNVKVDNQSISQAIDLQMSNSKYVTFSVTLSKPSNFTIGPCKLFIRSNSGSGNIVTYIIPQIQESGFTSSTTLDYGFTFYSSDFNFNGGFLYATLVQDYQPGTAWTSNNIPVIRSPIYNLTTNPSSNSIPCGSNTPITFSISSNSIGNLYQWNVGAGWIYNGGYTPTQITNSTGTLVLTPSSFPLGSVTVTPLFNFIAQPIKQFTVTEAPFTSSAVISGPTGICSGSANYTLAGIVAGQTVTWSLSNPAIATLSNNSNSGVTVTVNGTTAQTLSATITNACNQSTVKTFVINNGATTFVSTATITGTTTNACSGTRVFTVNNLPAGQNVAWSVSDSSVATLSGTSNAQATLNFIGNGAVILYASITNTCGQSSLKSVSMYAGVPTLTSFTCDPQGKPFCEQGQIIAYTSSIPELNYDDKVTAVFKGLTTTEANLATNWSWSPLNSKINLSGSKNNRTITSIFFGITGLQVRAKNSCGWSANYPLNWELVEVPDPIQKVSDLKDSSLTVFPNPSSSAWNISSNNVIIESISVTDVLGKTVYDNTFSKDLIAIDCSTFIKGIYFAKVKTDKGLETFKLIKN